MPTQPQFLSTRDAGAELGVPDWKVRRMIRSGALRHRRVGGRIVVPRSAIDEFLSGSDGPTAPATPKAG